MSNEAAKKTLADLPANFRQAVRVATKIGDERIVTKRFKKGDSVSFADHDAPFIFETDCLMEVEEKYEKKGDYGTPAWHTAKYVTASTRRAPTYWQRLKAWLMWPAAIGDRIPTAKVVKS